MTADKKSNPDQKDPEVSMKTSSQLFLFLLSSTKMICGFS